jgi:Ca2+-binding RTX toxin-like protein
MPAYVFETIGAQQALGILADDSLAFASGTATGVTVLYDAGGTITVVTASRTVIFSSTLAALTAGNRVTFPDGSRLYIGDATANAVDLGASNISNDALFGGAGDDSLNAGGGDNLLQGNQGADTLTSGGGRDTIYGGQDNDQISTGAGLNFAQGNKGDDTINGGNGSDILLGGQGNDVLVGGDGDGDYLDGNLGNDGLSGGSGNDQLYGEGGDDRIWGSGGSDTIIGGDGYDLFYGGDGDDSLSGGADDDEINGNNGNDTISGGDGDDLLGMSGGDSVSGGLGNDQVVGYWPASNSHNCVDLGPGDDYAESWLSGDTIDGGDGDDTIVAWGTAFVISGGAGPDRFVLHEIGTNPSLDKMPRILDWNAIDHVAFEYVNNEASTLLNYVETSASTYAEALTRFAQLEPQGCLYAAIQVGNDVVLFVDASSSSPEPEAGAILVGRTLSDIAVDNIVRT